MTQSIQVEKDALTLAQSTAKLIAKKIKETLTKKRRFSLVLSGGRTPELLYMFIAKEKMDWRQVDLFWGDERHVPPDSVDSNFRMVERYLISNISIPEQNIHRIKGEIPNAEESASSYENELRTYFTQHQAEKFDLVLLGMGRDGHTASLFPGQNLDSTSKSRWVQSFWVPEMNTFRISLLPEIINRSTTILVLVTGEDKAFLLHEILDTPEKSAPYPILQIHPLDGELVWRLDKMAASQLKNTPIDIHKD